VAGVPDSAEGCSLILTLAPKGLSCYFSFMLGLGLGLEFGLGLGLGLGHWLGLGLGACFL